VAEVVGLRHQVEVVEAEEVAVLDSVEQAERPLEPVVQVLAAVPEVDLLAQEEALQLVVEVVQQQVGPLVQEVS